jgi:hypothetical protein
MLAAATAGNYVIDGLGLGAAVGAPEPVPVHEGCAGHRNAGAIRDADVVPEADHGRHLYGPLLGVDDRGLGILVDGIGLTAGHQHHGAAGRKGGERLVGDIQKKHPALDPERNRILARERRLCAVRGAFGDHL